MFKVEVENMVRKLFISLFFILCATPLLGMNPALLKGMTFAHENKIAASPVAGATLLESGKVIGLYKEQSPVGEFSRRIGHVLDERYRLPGLLGHSFFGASPYFLGTLNKAIIDNTLEEFYESQTLRDWHNHYCHASKKGKKFGKFKNDFKSKLKPLSNLDKDMRDKATTVIAALAITRINTSHDMQEYAKGMSINSIPQRFEERELEVITPHVDQVVATLIKRKRNGFGFLEMHNLKCSFEGGNPIPLCVEESLWMVVNAILYNQTKNEFDFQFLPEKLPVLEGLKKFMEKHSNLKIDGYAEIAKQDWMNLVSNVPGIKYVRDNHEIDTDLLNIIKLLNYLFGTSVKSFEDFGKAISTGNRIITMTSKVLPNNDTVDCIELDISEQNGTGCSINWSLDDDHSSARIFHKIENKTLKEEDVDMIHVMNNYYRSTVPVAALSPDEFGQRFIQAIRDKKKETALELIALGANVYEEDNGRTALYDAVEDNEIEMVKFLLDNEVSPNRGVYSDESKDLTPLHCAIDGEYIDIVSLLIKAGADVNKWDRDEESPLCHALKKKNKKIISLLIKAGANVKESYSGMPFLCMAINRKDIDIVALLLKAGAYTDELKTRGWCSPLYQAIEVDNIEIVKLLLQQGTDVDAVGTYGLVALNEAIRKQNKDMVKLFLVHGADMHKIDKNKQNAMQVAIEVGNAEILDVLLNAV
jgi:ankyrin repeat protein